ncbi:hypothetical protein HanIR_Chr02g0073811 [Helianthus annuus]|nr:hypothetical protein HanIR_Chr02g0073811 [Helianthus annuus]
MGVVPSPSQSVPHVAHRHSSGRRSTGVFSKPLETRQTSAPPPPLTSLSPLYYILYFIDFLY